MTHLVVALVGALFAGIGLYRGRWSETRPWARTLYLLTGCSMVAAEAVIVAVARN